MRLRFSLFVFTILLVIPAFAEERNQDYGRLPLSFEENQGQLDRQIRFFSRGPGYGIFLTAGEAILRLNGQSASTVRMQVVGAAAHPEIEGIARSASTVNYLT